MSLRWGFLGASRIGRSALATAVLAAGHRLHAIAARDLSRAKTFAAAFAIPHATDSYEALLANPDIDAIYIALPNHLHLPWTLQALAAGKHVLCEKPLALTADEVAAMQRAESQSGCRVMEAFCHRFHPQFDFVRNLLQQNAIGETRCIQINSVAPITDSNDYRWKAAYGGGALFDLGCYQVSLMRSLLDREPISALGCQALRGDVDASFSAQLDFGGGLACQMFCAFEGARQQSLRILGSEGQLTIDWPISTKGRETIVTWNNQEQRFAPMDAYCAMVEHFAAAISLEAPMRFGLEDSYRQAIVMDELRRSATAS